MTKLSGSAHGTKIMYTDFMVFLVFLQVVNSDAVCMIIPALYESFIRANWLVSQHLEDPGVASSIPARSHTFVEIDHEIISTVILIPSAESFKKGCCQLQAKVCARSTG